MTALAAAVMLLSIAGSSALAQPSAHPLEPANTSSPRETLRTFLEAQTAIWTIVRDEGLGQRTRAGFQKATEHHVRGSRTLDLTEIAPEARAETADDVVVALYEVLLRIELPPMKDVPGDAEIQADPGLDRWTIPHTEITIHRRAEGPRQGDFLFTPETVRRAREFYDRVKALPYRQAPPVENVNSFIQVYGGWDVPIAWVDAMPSSFREVVWGQAVWKWLFLLVSMLAGVLVLWLAFRLTRRKVRPQSAREHLRNLVVPIVLLLLGGFVLPHLTGLLLLTEAVATVTDLTWVALVYISLAWIVWILIIAGSEAVIATPRIRAEGLDASLIRLTARVIAIIATVLLLFRGATAIGLPVVGLVASLSIGGLAIALAAQDTLKSLLGSFTILVDQPYRVGERIIADGHDGEVERIGLRSTSIRQLDGSVTTIPNETMATMNIENVGRRGSIRRKSELRLATGTPVPKVEEALGIVRAVLDDHEGMPPDQPARIHFRDFNPDSLSIVVMYWYQPPDFWAFSDFSERVNLEILRRFAAAGIDLAPPTSMTRFAGETGLPFDVPPPSKSNPAT
jgi:MscS family membrane protein